MKYKHYYTVCRCRRHVNSPGIFEMARGLKGMRSDRAVSRGRYDGCLAMVMITEAASDEISNGARTEASALWDQILREAEDALSCDFALAPLLENSVLARSCLEDALIHRITTRLGNETLAGYSISDLFHQAIAEDPAIGAALDADIVAVRERDPACRRLIEPLLYFKGFHALTTHRLAHWLWTNHRPDIALYLQSRSSAVFHADINPAAHFGKGIFLDHATGLVVGATAVVENDVSILQDVTLGGTGKEIGDRHPKVRRGVMIGAGAKILGNIEIGASSRIAAGSIVLHPVPAGTTVAGIPARVIGTAGAEVPARSMDQVPRQLAYDSFTYVI
jgi:serine O-acetyltransferase